MKASTHWRLKSFYFQGDAWLKRNWLIGLRGPRRQIIGSCRAPGRYGHVFWWGKWPPQWETCSVNVIQRWRPLVLLWLIAAHGEIKRQHLAALGRAESRMKSRKRKMWQMELRKWRLPFWIQWSSGLINNFYNICETDTLLTGSVREMDGRGGAWAPGWQGGGQRGQGRQGPPFSIYWSGRERAGSFEAVKWSEFQHDHGDCSRPGRHFDEVVLKMERMFCARRFKGRFLFCWSWNYTQAGERAAVANLNLQEGRLQFKWLEFKIIKTVHKISKRSFRFVVYHFVFKTPSFFSPKQLSIKGKVSFYQ